MATDHTQAALGAEAATPATQAAAARDGLVTYDELRGPDLDAARWRPARPPLPTGGEHLPLDPNAELAVGNVVESPYEDFDDDFTRLRACEVTLDRGGSTAAWRVDGHTVYQTHGTIIRLPG
jgi:hypothetical protein